MSLIFATKGNMLRKGVQDEMIAKENISVFKMSKTASHSETQKPV